jgi:hypothetical protein
MLGGYSNAAVRPGIRLAERMGQGWAGRNLWPYAPRPGVSIALIIDCANCLFCVHGANQESKTRQMALSAGLGVQASSSRPRRV